MEKKRGEGNLHAAARVADRPDEEQPMQANWIEQQQQQTQGVHVLCRRVHVRLFIRTLVCLLPPPSSMQEIIQDLRKLNLVNSIQLLYFQMRLVVVIIRPDTGYTCRESGKNPAEMVFHCTDRQIETL